MTTPMMRTAPHLPLLNMAQCVAVFKQVGIPKAVLARMSGFARMQVFRWFTGRSVRPLPVTLEYVSELAYNMIRADLAGTLPQPACTKGAAWAKALNDANYPTPLSQQTLAGLVSPEWAHLLNLPLEVEDVTA